MTPLIDFTNPMAILTATVLFVLFVLLGKETKKSSVPGIMLVVFLMIIAGHTVEYSMLKSTATEIQNVIAQCITYDFVFILLSFFVYLWIDDIQAKEEKRKSLDDSLSWFWTKV